MGDLTRFEILPFARGEQEAAALPEPVRLTVTCSPARGLDQSVDLAIRLRDLGHVVTVHLAARMVRDRAHLDRVLADLAQAKVDDAFVIAGDAPTPLGPYGCALELLSDLYPHPNRPRMLGIAGYPEGHPKIAQDALVFALTEKARLASYVTTQLCFNPDVLVSWIRSVRASGLVLPVIVGLPGLVEGRRLLEIAVRVGVGSSLAFLRKQVGIGNLLGLSSSSVERLHKALSPLLSDRSLDIGGFHYFTFNRLLESWRWAQGLTRHNSGDVSTQSEVTTR